MAEEQFGTILTTIGKAKIANAALLGNRLVLKTLKIGDSNGQYYEPIESQTELKHEVYSCDIGSIKIDDRNPNWVKVETILSSSVGGFTIREVGICDADGDLIAISKYPETYKPIIENGAGKDICIRLILEVSNAEQITLNLDPSVIIATKEDVDNLQKQINNNTSQLNDMANNIKKINGTNDTAIDCNNVGIVGEKTTYKTNENTLNTPYKSGLTNGYSAGLVETYLSSNANGIQLHYSTGEIYIFMRKLIDGVWKDWKKVMIEEDTGWIDLPLLNGATTTDDKAMYRRISKMVYFKGVINNITTNNFIFGNLPIGFRPNSISGGGNIPVSLFLPAEDSPSRLIIYKNGNLELTRKNDRNSCFLDGVMFVLD